MSCYRKVFELVQLNSRHKRVEQTKADIKRIMRNLDQQVSEKAVGIPVIDLGKKTPLYIQLKGLIHKRMF